MYNLNKDNLKKINLKSVTFGSDPEFFIINKKTNQFIQSCGWIGGTKKEPIYIEEGLGFQEDNVALEYNVPPTINSQNLFDNIQKLHNHIKTIHKFEEKNLDIVCVSSGRFNVEELVKSPQALKFGCDPDFNAWTNTQNEISDSFTDLRTCGGHLHIGYDSPNDDTNLKIIRLLDLYLGVPSVLLDLDTERKILYGKAGAHRMQKYGVEYRVLSNFWVNDLNLIDWVFKNAFKALISFNKGMEFTQDECNLIQNCINQNDMERAQYIIEKYNISVPNKENKTIKQIVENN